jgi:cell wall-associated NlpC family hydrolase
MKKLVSLLVVISVVFLSSIAWASGYAVAKKATPVFNTPDFISLYKIDSKRSEQLEDDCYHMKELEFIALPKTVFEVKEIIIKNGVNILSVKTDDYPYPSSGGYYIDTRYVKKTSKIPKTRRRESLSKKKIVKRMKSMLGYRYTWGGNYHDGLSMIPSDYFSDDNDVGKTIRNRLTFRGVDCSGLLYEATNAYTPRNTSGLVKFGEPVAIAGKHIEEIISQVKPLDIIVWRGHVMIILDKKNVIESRADYEKNIPGCQGGVKIRPLKAVLKEVLKDRVAVNNYDNTVQPGKKKFVIRRWFASK